MCSYWNGLAGQCGHIVCCDADRLKVLVTGCSYIRTSVKWESVPSERVVQDPSVQKTVKICFVAVVSLQTLELMDYKFQAGLQYLASVTSC